MLDFITWTVDPELLHIGSLTVRWYGLLWAVGFLLGYTVEDRIYKREGLPEGTMDKVFLFMVFGTIIGARLGHCFFYEWDYFIHHPVELLYIWKGGLSSHGGAVGILTVMFIFSRLIKKSYLWVLDRIVIAVAICGACIRLGNLMNHEIYGDPTSMPWAFSFMLHPLAQTSTFSEPSHPTQIYEMLYCLITFGIIMYMYWRTEARKHTGLIFGVFLIGVFLSRYLLEFIKRPQEDFESNMLLNMGQILSLPLVIAGICLIFYNLYKWRTEHSDKVKNANLAMGGLAVFFAVALFAPLANRASELKAATSNAAVLDDEIMKEQMPEMNESQVIDFLNQTEFISDQGIHLHFKHGNLYLQDQKIGGSLHIIVSSTPSQYYIQASSLKADGYYRYVLRAMNNNKSVLINAEDPRGEYYVNTK